MKGLVAAFVAGLIIGLATAHAAEPSCPQEDSCTADYRDGRWHIKEVTP